METEYKGDDGKGCLMAVLTMIAILIIGVIILLKK